MTGLVLHSTHGGRRPGYLLRERPAPEEWIRATSGHPVGPAAARSAARGPRCCGPDDDGSGLRRVRTQVRGRTEKSGQPCADRGDHVTWGRGHTYGDLRALLAGRRVHARETCAELIGVAVQPDPYEQRRAPVLIQGHRPSELVTERDVELATVARVASRAGVDDPRP